MKPLPVLLSIRSVSSIRVRRSSSVSTINGVLGFINDRRVPPLERLLCRIGVTIPFVGVDQVLSPSFYQLKRGSFDIHRIKHAINSFGHDLHLMCVKLRIGGAFPV